MFKHLLIPTDGSAASEAAVRQALAMAKETDARLTVLHVVEPFHVMAYGIEMIEETRESYEAQARERANKILQLAQRQAVEFGVPADTEVRFEDHPYEAIIGTAAERGCDLIVMASHGRRGVQALLLGSETHKVLTHTRLPVLVLRSQVPAP
jgi:nucleotide-binding universal stress UspA family protein